MENKSQQLEPFLLAILSGRFTAVSKEMANTLARSGRSTVLNTAKDFSCGITDKRCRIVSIAEGLPIHLSAINLIPQVLLELFKDDIHPGDVFLNNSPYYGNTHHGDFSMCAPVFYKGELEYFVINRAHQGDTGAPIPTTFLPHAKTIFEEGLHIPCVRVQRGHKDIEDVIRMIKYRNRIPDLWYGDYLAQVGSLRIAETRLIEMCDRYGVATLRAFIDQWQEYGKERMIAEIKKLPQGEWEGEVCHDPVPGLVPEGIRLKAKIIIDPKEGYITVDLRDNQDNIPCGMNLAESTSIGGSLVGVLYNLDPTIPHNDGAFSRIKILMKDGGVVGKPKFPVGTSVCTTNVCDRLMSLIQSTIAKIGPPYGIAEGCTSMGAASAVISGTDWRRGNVPFMNFLVSPGPGPALYGHDGWLTCGCECVKGGIAIDSIELDEQRNPILFKKYELVTDSGGPGQWDGAPAADVVFGPRHDPGSYSWVVDEKVNPAKGVCGGSAGRPSDVYKINIKTGKKEELSAMDTVTLTPDERLVALHPGGAGYGNPLDRDPELVKSRVREGWVSLQRANDIYGVILDTSGEEYAVNFRETEKRREQLRQERIGKK
jgi:N-methylhydantoinase B